MLIEHTCAATGDCMPNEDQRSKLLNTGRLSPFGALKHNERTKTNPSLDVVNVVGICR